MLKRHEFTLIHLLHRVCQNFSLLGNIHFDNFSSEYVCVDKHKYIIECLEEKYSFSIQRSDVLPYFFGGTQLSSRDRPGCLFCQRELEHDLDHRSIERRMPGKFVRYHFPFRGKTRF